MALPVLALLSLAGWARAGTVTVMMRNSEADRSFPADSFSTSTHPSSDDRLTQIRILGQGELGDGIFTWYDLRYGFSRSSSVKSGAAVVTDSSGLQDQDVAIGYHLGRGNGFSHEMRLGVVAPGSDAIRPSLGAGEWALEPIYQIAIAPDIGGFTIGLEVGTRAFLNGASAQFRSRLQLSAPVTERLRLSGEVTYRRSMLFSSYDPRRDDAELSNILRPGIQAEYELTGSIATVAAYQVYVAGLGGHASRRFTLGLAWRY